LPTFFQKIAALLMPRRSGHAASTHEHVLGKRGEKAAARYLREDGYTILERNYRAPGGEIDLVAFRDGMLGFVEVRARSDAAQLDPVYSVNRRKQRRILQAARHYAARHEIAHEAVMPRFDVITVLFDERMNVKEINHIEGAFEG